MARKINTTKTKRKLDRQKAVLQSLAKGSLIRLKEYRANPWELTDKDHAQAALETVFFYDASAGLTGNELEIQISDLLADIMYLCAKEGLDFDTVLNRATGYFSEGN